MWGKYGHSMQAALEAAFPSLKMDANIGQQQDSQISSITPSQQSKGYWADIRNVRAFFDRYAAAFNFNPLRVEAWNAVDMKALLRYHVRILSLALK